MSVERKSLYPRGISHGNPVPGGVKIGNLVFSSMVLGSRNPDVDRRPADADEEAEWMFRNMQELVESAGGTTDNVAFVTVYLKEGDDREAIVKSLNKAWVKMFPNENSRPARGLFNREQGSHFSLQVVAVLDS